MTPEQEKAQAEYDAAFRVLSDSQLNGSSRPLNARRGYEQRYGIAYKKLVTLGVQPRLRARYRSW